MVSKAKPDPYMVDFETAPLTEDEVKRLRPARDVFAEHGIPLPGRPPQGAGKQQVTLRLDKDVISFFKQEGPGWQTRLNAALAKLVDKEKKAG